MNWVDAGGVRLAPRDAGLRLMARLEQRGKSHLPRRRVGGTELGRRWGTRIRGGGQLSQVSNLRYGRLGSLRYAKPIRRTRGRTVPRWVEVRSGAPASGSAMGSIPMPVPIGRLRALGSRITRTIRVTIAMLGVMGRKGGDCDCESD